MKFNGYHNKDDWGLLFLCLKYIYVKCACLLTNRKWPVCLVTACSKIHMK